MVGGLKTMEDFLFLDILHTLYTHLLYYCITVALLWIEFPVNQAMLQRKKNIHRHEKMLLIIHIFSGELYICILQLW